MEGPLRESSRAGLCARCAHARVVTSDRGSEFWRCALSEHDERFPKYPRLPVIRCSGFVERSPPGSPDA